MTHRHDKPRLRINARLVKEKDRARARELRRFVLYGAAIVVPLLAYVGQRIDFLRTSYRIEALEKQKSALESRGRELVVERSHLLSPDRIERVARRQLGLADPAPQDVRRVVLIDGRVESAARAAARHAAPDGTRGPGGAATGEERPGSGDDVEAVPAFASMFPEAAARRDAGGPR